MINGPSSKALLVGISDYGPHFNALPGCKIDIATWRVLLSKTYDVHALRTLTDHEATRTGVEAGLRWLFEGAKAGDELVFIYAGHGTQTVHDHTTEDALFFFPNRDDGSDATFFDDDLTKLVTSTKLDLGQTKLTLVLDCCYSGGLVRALEKMPATAIPRFVVLPTPRTDVPTTASKPFGRLQNTSDKAKPLVVAAAKATEMAWDDQMADGQHHGVFSYYAVEALTRAPKSAYHALISEVTPQIDKQFPQHPMLAGDVTRRGHVFLT